jgi:hypothetical protein
MTVPQPWPQVLRAAVVSGTLASLASAAVLAWRGLRDAGDAAAPLNGPSQWVWGRAAPSARGFSVKHTVVGYASHHLAATFWAVLYERARLRKGNAIPIAVATAAVADVVDYVFTPKRLQPGYERQLSKRSLVLAYAAFALGLAAQATLRARKSRAASSSVGY